MNKKLLVSTLGLVTLIGAGVVGVNAVHADDIGPYPPILQRLIERFNLNEDEVTTFFEEQKLERQTLIQQTRDERLSQAVEDGIITQEQKEALVNRWEEKKAEMTKHREEMQAWFDEQGIDREALMQYGGFGHHGFGRWH